AVDGQAPALAGPALGTAVAFAVALPVVPGIGVGHVGAGTEHAARTAEEQHLHAVVVGDVVEGLVEEAAHGRVVGVLAVGMVQRDPGDAGAGVLLHHHGRHRLRSYRPFGEARLP